MKLKFGKGKKTVSILLFLSGIPLTAFLFNNCATDKLTGLSSANTGVYNYGTVSAQFCTSEPSPAQQNIKYLFILDHSALNKPGIPLYATQTTNADSSGARRYGPLLNFVQNLTVNAVIKTSFDVIDFADTAQQMTGLNNFDSNTTDFETLLTADWVGSGTQANPSPLDSGFTNYETALAAAYTLIQNDLKGVSAIPSANITANSYQIIFVSGGEPVVPAPGGTSLYTQTFSSDLGPIIAQLMALKTDPTLGPYVGNISLNTAYYYGATDPSDPAVITLLQQMATAGNGLFVNFGGGEQILYQEFAPTQVNLQNYLADVFVENKNAVWWDNGVFMLDSDGDGLPDLIETQLGSNPYSADSDGNGVSDLVEYRSKGMPCASSSCSHAQSDPYSVCAGFNPVADSNGNVTFQSTSKDGLNDCEKYVLGANYREFSSSGSLIPDFLALKNSISIHPGNPQVAMQDPFGDGVTNYYKLKLGLPATASVQTLTNFTQRSTALTVSSTPDPATLCYNLSVGNVALSAPRNTIRVSVVQNKNVGQDEPTLMISEGVMGGNFQLNLSSSSFH
jgi:hypothetical protein